MAKSSRKTANPSFPKTRKQLRKEKRQLQKAKRNENYKNRNKADPANSDVTIEKPSKSTEQLKKARDERCRTNNLSTIEKQLRQKQRELSDFKKLQKDMMNERRRQLVEANEKEDLVIKSLEKKLKMNKRKTKSVPKSFALEGLDYLLEVCDPEKYKDSVNLEKELNENVTDFDNDLAVVTGKDLSNPPKEKANVNDEINSDGSDSNEYDDDLDDGDDDSNFNDNNFNNTDSSAENEKSDYSSDSDVEKLEVLRNQEKNTKSLSHLLEIKSKKIENDKKSKGVKKHDTSTRMKMLQAFIAKESETSAELPIENSESDDDDGDQCDEHSLKRKSDDAEVGKKKLREDIYGRLRDEDGNIVENYRGKYIPPQLRTSLHNSSNENTEVLQRLRKQMKGALNRLAESNLHSITAQIEDLYMNHSRNDCNSVLLKLIKESLVSSVLSPERIVIEHAFFISLLHANVGSEIGAYILQHFVEEWDSMYRNERCVEDKRIDNIVLFLCQMYNFKIFHSCLIYEILNKFVESFGVKEVELILLVLKNVGFSLRKDDPASLKELIHKIQKKSNESVELRENTRVRFMLDTLSAVKNNNTLKIQNYDPSYIEHLKKIQKSFLRTGKYVTELKISVGDLLNADTRGRWWIVGSAWTGHINQTNASQEKMTGFHANKFDQHILNLAKKHRMNIDTRKTIFCILMTAEDFVDAFEKLVKLGLRGQQCQEIIYVLMHCLLKEKKYNPYYGFIAEQFCSVDRKYQLAIQFSTWDKFKEINSFTNQQITNLAKFLTYLFVELKLPLSILKVLQFAEMNKPTVKLIRQIVLAILLNDDETTVVEVFSRIAKSEKLFMLREGLQLFLHHFVLKNIDKNVIDDDRKFEMLSKRVELAVNTMRGSTSDF